MTHDELQEDLAAHLRGGTDRMVWTDTQLGPAGSPRPDVFTVAKSFSRWAADAYEIKISVPDLRRDVTSGKWQSYLKFAHRVWFAFPQGLVSLDNIPRECGVIVRHEKCWRAARKPVAQVLDSMPRDAWLKLLMESCPDQVSRPHHRRADEWFLANAARQRFGEEVAQVLDARRDARRSYEYQTERLKEQAKSLAAEVDANRKRAMENEQREARAISEALKSLGLALGMPAESIDAHSLRERIYQLKRDLQGYSLEQAAESLARLSALVNAKEAA